MAINHNGPNGSAQGGVGGNSTSGSHSGNQGGGNKGGGGGNQGGTGLRGPTDSTGQFADHTNYSGPAGAVTGQTNPNAGTGGVGSNYQGARSDFVNRSWLGRQFQATPNVDQPASFANGISHFGFNPASLAGGLIGAAIPIPGVGSLLSLGAGQLYSHLGGKDVVLGSGAPSPTDPSSNIHDFSGGTFSGQNTPRGVGNPGAGGGVGVALPGASQVPGNAPFGAQPSASSAPGMFSPSLPNHSLPQGYQSAFPGSLSDQDKQLLYAKALGGM